MWDEGRGCVKGQLRCFAHPLGGVVCAGDHVQGPAFAPNPRTLFTPGSSKDVIGFFCLFVFSIVLNLPQLHMHTFMFSSM